MTTDYRARIYNRYAVNFMDEGETFNAEASARWGKLYDWYFRRWLPADKDAAVIDLACGGGKLLHFFQTRGYRQVSGVDVSPDQVILARQIVPQVHEGNVLDFLEGNREKYDLITALDIVEHFQKDEALRFLDGCYAALRPGGRLILQTPNADTPWGTYHRYNDFTHEICFQHNSISRLLRLCGFDSVEVREQGPVPLGYSMFSSLRWLLWQTIRLNLKIYNLAEIGSTGSGIFTRVFLASGKKQASSSNSSPAGIP